MTYRLSTLPRELWGPHDSVAIVRRESDRAEAEALAAICRDGTGAVVPPAALQALGPQEAALLPGAFEAHGGVRRFTAAPRLTEHVRHRSKYLDMPIAEGHAFVFGEGAHLRHRARSLKEFMSLLATTPAPVLLGHVTRRDFSRWIEDVFRDGPLARRIRTIEAETDEVSDVPGAVAAISQAIRARYDPPNGPAVLDA
ncbi:MAG: hypothetical protein R2712_24435 [Vicinamibacterales bacterium]